MELFAFLKAMAVLAFVSLGGLKMLQWLLVGIVAAVALIALRRARRSPVALGVGILLLAVCIWLSLIPVPGHNDFYGEPGQYATMRQRNEAQTACEVELAALPDRYPVASLVDEEDDLEDQSVIRLLTLRQLDFVEIRLRDAASRVKVPVYKSFSSQLPKPAGASDARYVRLALAAEGAPDCLTATAMTEVMRHYLKVWPLPQGRCLQLRHSTEAGAGYSLAYVLEPQPGRPIWGRYRITERASGNVVAQLTSADGYEAPTQDVISDFNPASQRPGCRTPHTALADRLMGVRGAATAPHAAAR